MTELTTPRHRPRHWFAVTPFDADREYWIADRPSPIPHRADWRAWDQLLKRSAGTGEPLAATTAELDHLWPDRPSPTINPRIFNHPIIEITDWPDWL